MSLKLHAIYSNMTDIHHPDAEWIKLHYIKDGIAHYTLIKGVGLTDETRHCNEVELVTRAIVEAYTEERDNEIKNFVFYDCFQEGKKPDFTTNAALEKYTWYEIRAFLEGFMNPISIEQCKTTEEWIEHCLEKREDLFWENHPWNQDYED